ncbi:hypothetical protein ACS0TY_011855 [Phlomoides rotata]
MACCIIHNFIRKEMDVDPLEGELDEFVSEPDDDQPNNEEFIESMESTPEWSQWRDIIAQSIMEMHEPGTGNGVVKGKAFRGRRSWSRVEEDALIHCLIDIVNDEWKTENGFKAGF